MAISFCSHGNVVGLCNECSPRSDPTVDKSINCPVFVLLGRGASFSFGNSVTMEQINEFVSCANEGVIVRQEKGDKSESYECTSCGWAWHSQRRNSPKLVKCDMCGRISVELQSRSSHRTCSDCGRKYMRQKNPYKNPDFD